MKWKGIVLNAGIVKSVYCPWTNRRCETIEVTGKGWYRRNNVWGTYNSIKSNDLLGENDVPNIWFSVPKLGKKQLKAMANTLGLIGFLKDIQRGSYE